MIETIRKINLVLEVVNPLAALVFAALLLYGRIDTIRRR